MIFPSASVSKQADCPLKEARRYYVRKFAEAKMKKITLSNTLSRGLEEFRPINPERITLYVCGPTVYDLAHIGNARPVVVFDVLFRLLRHIYGEAAVLYARNFTDIDDKIIARAEESQEPVATLTARYIAAYQEDMEALGALEPSFTPRATDHLAGMIALCQDLEAKGAAYRGKSGLWFSVGADRDYGKLSGRKLEDLRAGARVESESDKRDDADFALWKAAKPGEPAWDSPFGPGRPGWHIECSAMIEEIFGGRIDIHAGGHDLIFPHHENEIAQSETAHGRPLAGIWLHNGFLTMQTQKMSKSVGNIATVRALRTQWPPEALRYALLSAHYRAPLEWSDGVIAQAVASLDRLYGALQRLRDVAPPTVAPPDGVLEALCEDLNTPRALAALFELAAEANKAVRPQDGAHAKAALLAGGALLGLLQADPQAWFRGGVANSEEIDALVAGRTGARAAKDWAKADQLRDELTRRGIEVLDGASGSSWRRKV